MKCENLKAYLDGELGPISRRLMRAHVRSCDACRRNSEEWERLSRQIDGLEGEPAPQALRERVLADAMTAAAVAQSQISSPVSPRPRTQGRIKMKRVLIVAVFVAVLLLAGFWFMPHHGHEVALADVARAMQNVQSAHFVGVSLDTNTGNFVRVEGWVKGSRKMRTNTEGISEEVHNSATWTVINLRSKPVLAHIYTERKSHLFPGTTYLDLFNGSIATQRGMIMSPNARMTSSPVTLSDGRAALVMEVAAREAKIVFTIDSQTNLLITWEKYHNGKLSDKVERIEYNIEIPDSIFTIEFPKGAIVINATKPNRISAEQRARYADWKKSAERLHGGIMLSQFSPGEHGSCGTPFHSRLMFEVLSNDGMLLVYLPDRNAYQIFGKAMVHEDGNDGNPGPIVENGEYDPLTPSDITVEQWKVEEVKAEQGMPSPEVRAQWNAKAKELKAVGAKHLCQAGGQFWPVGNTNGGCTFEALNDKNIDVWYSPTRREYYVLGKARIYDNRGFDKTVENGWIKVPGPPPDLPQ